ncbi:MAG: hypothetical protein JWO86_6486 [Myxococcaceae bacterium]|jgi:hypothetical protein|nr:hypothetical protein [Myxococcaceae bacterium]MEA2748061.1 hypothetical protein [Myxococcales bacterium]
MPRLRPFVLLCVGAACLVALCAGACTGTDPVLGPPLGEDLEAGSEAGTDGATGDAISSNDTGTTTDAGSTVDGACGVLTATGGNVTLPIDTTAVDMATSFTIEAWVKPAQLVPGATYNVVDRWQSNSLGSFGLQIHDGFAVFRMNCTGAGVGSDTTAKGEGFRLEVGKWTHIAGVFQADATLDSGSIRVFTRGFNSGANAVGTSCRRPVAVPQPMRIASTMRQPGDPFQGVIDEVRLSSTDRYQYIGGNPDGGTPDFQPERFHTVDAMTLSLWRFSEIGETTTFDSVIPPGGTPRNGTLFGGVAISGDCTPP